MYTRGYFKLGNIPTALAGVTLLGLCAVVGYIHVRHSDGLVPYQRSVLAPGLQPTSSYAHGLTLLYMANCLVVAIAIFHAGAFPLYTYSSKKRFDNTLQDSFASFGWTFLALHHIVNLATLAMLTLGPAWTARLAPALLLLPATHFALRLFPSVPPSAHYWLGLGWDSTHFLLIGQYMYRTVTISPWEVYGVLAEALHLLSAVPEYLAHHNRPDGDWDSRSQYRPFGAETDRMPGATAAAAATAAIAGGGDELKSAAAAAAAAPAGADEHAGSGTAHPHTSPPSCGQVEAADQDLDVDLDLDLDGQTYGDVAAQLPSAFSFDQAIMAAAIPQTRNSTSVHKPQQLRQRTLAAQDHSSLAAAELDDSVSALLLRRGQLQKVTSAELDGDVDSKALDASGAAAPVGAAGTTGTDMGGSRGSPLTATALAQLALQAAGGEGGTGALGPAAGPPPSVFPLLVLINCLSFFFYGSMMAFQQRVQAA